MTQDERRVYLIEELLKEGGYREEIPQGEQVQKDLLRALMNVREPLAASDEFLKIQDEYLKERNSARGIVNIEDFEPVKSDERLYLWKGDITTLKVDAIVNAATGTYKKLDTGFPKIKGTFGATNGNVVLYRASFAAGDLNANGINEVALMNGNTAAAKCLAYAQITPSVNVTSADSLQIDWQITVSGS